MTRVLPVAAAVVGLAAAVLAPGAAAQQPQYVRCPGEPEAARCARLSVPLDRTGEVAGSVDLLLARLKTRGPATGTVIFLAGGPGQAAVPALGPVAEALGPALRGRELVTFDQRGTGASGALRCRSLMREGAVSVSAAVADCGRELGPRRRLFTTQQSVEDLEAVRVSLGAPRVSLVGVSYGTKVAAAYAARYPGAVERLVLDSVVPPEGPDPFARSSLRAVPSVLADLCRGRACRGATPDPRGDVARLAARLRERPIRAVGFGASGRPRRVTVTEGTLALIVQRGDLDLVTRARTPAAIRSALLGDPAPLARLVLGGGSAGGAGVGLPVLVTTLCQEAPTPWRRGSSAEARAGEARAAAAALRPEELGPFGASAALTLSTTVRLCGLWPEDQEPAPPASGPMPDVPVLAIAGGGDVRTPVEDARAVAARYPRGRLLVVPRAGHSVLSRGEECVRRGLARFFADRPVAPCREPGVAVVTNRDPTSLRQLPPAPGTTGRRGRVVTAAVLTLADVTLTGLGGGSVFRAGLQMERGPRAVRGGGLRGGRFRLSQDALRLERVVYVPGVRVSGTVRLRGERPAGRLEITADRASGTLRIAPDGSLRGRLGGREVRSRDE